MARVLRPERLTRLRQTGRVTVADHRVFAVERLTYADLPASRSGGPPEIFVLACANWCNVLAETPEGDLVFVWQYRFGSDALSLEIPGGVIDPGEEPVAAARRELREETGYEATAFELVSVVEPNPALAANRCFTFLARGAVLTGETAFDDLEDLEVVRIPRADVAAVIDEGVVTHALVIVALEAYLRRFGPTTQPSSSV